MCVILVADTKRPTEEMIRKAYTSNDHGAGIAWIEPAEDGIGNEVVWSKGLNLEDLLELVATLPLPMVIHCRIASCGGKCDELTHPFPIEEDAPLYLEGRTKGSVLFHNGHWGDYKKWMLDTCRQTGKKLPMGKLSDTRAMAWLCSIYGSTFMDLIEEKGVEFSPDGARILWGGSHSGWTVVDEIWASNTSFQYSGGYRQTGSYDTRPMCRHGRCTSRDLLGDTNFCKDHCPEDRKPKEKISSPPLAPSNNLSSSGAVSQTGTATTAIDGGTKQVFGSNGKLVPGSGGPQSDTPLSNWERAQLSFHDGKISRKQFKRARNAFKGWIQSERRAGRVVDIKETLLSVH